MNAQQPVLNNPEYEEHLLDANLYGQNFLDHPASIDSLPQQSLQLRTDTIQCLPSTDYANIEHASNELLAQRKRKDFEPWLEHAVANLKRVRNISNSYPQPFKLPPLRPPVPNLGLEDLSPMECVRDEYMEGHFEEVPAFLQKERDIELVDAVSELLESICARNEQRVTVTVETIRNRNAFFSRNYPDGSSSVFFSLKKPMIVMKKYVERLVKYMQVSRSVFIVALIYLDRVHESDETLALTNLNVHRLITTALGIATKYLEDEALRNTTVCRIGGVPTLKEMNLLESQFLRRLSWNCSISVECYERYEQNIFRNVRGCIPQEPHILDHLPISACSETHPWT